MSVPANNGHPDAGLLEALHGEMVPKFLATLDESNNPNVVPIISLDAMQDGTLAFGELFIQKTRRNLQNNPHVAAIVVTEDLQIWTMRARFCGFEESGPRVEYLNDKNLFRYNAYLGVRRAVVFDSLKVTGTWKLSKLNVAAELIPARAWSMFSGKKGPTHIPARVAEKFARTEAIKVIAFSGKEAYPEILPAFSLLPAGASMFFGTRIFRKNLSALAPGTRVAASVITTEPVAYQVKGTFSKSRITPGGRMGSIDIDEVFSASPPLVGERIAMHTGG